MMKLLLVACLFAFLIVRSAQGFPRKPRYNKRENCDVGIVGGGLSGLYMAFEILTKDADTKVCIFEKDDRVGGRIRDHRFEEASNIDVGLGAWRVDKNQLLMIDFLYELKIPFKDWSFVTPTVYEAREIVSANAQGLKIAYPALKNDPKFGNYSKSDLWNYILKPENLRKVGEYASVYTYLSDMITSEGAKFLMNLQFHRGEVVDLVEPASFFEWIKLMNTLTGKYFRPVGGMSAIIDTLYENVKDLGVKLFMNTKVTSITKLRKRRSQKYVIRTSKFVAMATKLVIAVPPGHFRKVAGTIARKIQKTPQFDSILPIQAFKGGAIYEEPWWEKVKIGGSSIKAGQQFISQDNCVGSSLPHRGYGENGEGVLHTVYTDGACARRWQGIFKLGKNYIDDEVHRALEAKYGMKIPRPIKTEYQYWDPAWHYQKPGTTYSLEDIMEWAKKPFKREDIYVVGESYHPMRGWCQGAIVSCRHALNEGWGIQRDVEEKVPKKGYHELIMNDDFDVL